MENITSIHITSSSKQTRQLFLTPFFKGFVVRDYKRRNFSANMFCYCMFWNVPRIFKTHVTALCRYFITGLINNIPPLSTRFIWQKDKYYEINMKAFGRGRYFLFFFNKFDVKNWSVNTIIADAFLKSLKSLVTKHQPLSGSSWNFATFICLFFSFWYAQRHGRQRLLGCICSQRKQNWTAIIEQNYQTNKQKQNRHGGDRQLSFAKTK